MEKVLVIVGPTAVGKTSLSIQLAKKFNGEIISGDSMQVYRNLDIGTAKATAAEQKEVPHHLLDFKNAAEQYSAAEFIKDAGMQIDEITARGKLPIVVGGTGFYLDSLLKGLTLGSDTNSKFRIQMKKVAAERGSTFLWDELNKVDHLSAEKISKENTRRIIRALEVFEQTGKSITSQENSGERYDSLIVGLNTNRPLLYQRINDRVDEMMNKGLVAENERLYYDGGTNLPASKGIGYREFEAYFKGDRNLTEVAEEIKKDSRHYAKRQLTWFRNKMNVNWFDLIENPSEKEQIDTMVENWR